MLTVIIPVYNEADNIRPVLDELTSAAQTIPISEIVYVDDGSTDGTFALLCALQEKIPMLCVVRHTVRAGQSAAFMSGVRAAGNALVALMDGDGQNDPRDIAILFDCYQRNSAGQTATMVAGFREKRHDNLSRRLSSRAANRIRSAFLADGIIDTGCSLKLIRRKDYLALPYFDHMHRYLPALLRRDGVNIYQVGVSHRPRARGTSKYGFWGRLSVGIVDLLGVRWLLARGLPPHFAAEEMAQENEDAMFEQRKSAYVF